MQQYLFTLCCNTTWSTGHEACLCKSCSQYNFSFCFHKNDHYMNTICTITYIKSIIIISYSHKRHLKKHKTLPYCIVQTEAAGVAPCVNMCELLRFTPPQTPRITTCLYHSMTKKVVPFLIIWPDLSILQTRAHPQLVVALAGV